MKFNNKILYDNYKKITRKCIHDGYAIPLMIRDYPVPQKYKYSHSELEKFYKQISPKEKHNLNQMLKNRRQIELSILRKENKDYKNINEFYESELQSFFNKYTEFQNITGS